MYNGNSTLSDSVMRYYRDARNIPYPTNVLRLDELDTLVDITDGGVTHTIYLNQQGEVIEDTMNRRTETPTIHSWLYFNQKIAVPIANYLKNTYVNGTPLKDIIRFIVLCKGVPFRIQAKIENGNGAGVNVVVANLLSLLGETMVVDTALLYYYGKNFLIGNPYYSVDPNFTMDHNFLPNHYHNLYSIEEQNREISLSYLVTHLSAPRFSDVKRMVDSSLTAINQTDYEWFIDADPTPCRGGWASPIGSMGSIFQYLGITNYFFNNDETVYTSNPSLKRVMSYSSNGVHTTIGPYIFPNCQNYAFSDNYIQTQLNFSYAPGAIFNTLESFSGRTIGTYPVIRIEGQGRIADFLLMGGTVAVGQAFHVGGSSYLVDNDINFTHYAAGYTFIESAYMGMRALNGTNVIVGDPLCRIATPRSTITLTQNTTLASGDYYNRIIVPEGITLTIEATDTINLRRNASIIIKGNLLIGDRAVLNFYDYSNLSYYKNNVHFTDGKLNYFDKSSLVFNGNCVLSSIKSIYFFDNSFLFGKNFTISGGEFLFFNNYATLKCDSVTILSSAIIHFNDYSSLNVISLLNVLGTATNGIQLLTDNIYKNNFFITNGKHVEISYAFFDDIAINLTLSDSASVNISNLTCINSGDFYINVPENTIKKMCTMVLQNSTITGAFDFWGLSTNNLNDVFISNLILTNTNSLSLDNGVQGISNYNCVNATISDNHISNFSYGVYFDRNIPNYSTLNYLIENNQLDNCITGIYLNNFESNELVIKKNLIDSPLNERGNTSGISLSNISEIAIESNFIIDYDYGINLSSITNPYISDNTIQILNNSETKKSGIFSSSSHGIYRANLISGYNIGIELGNSSPKIGQNVITDNSATGLYVTSNSFPILSEGLIQREGEPFKLPVSGFNNIFENGGDYDEAYPYNGAEIHIFDADIDLAYGCNTIADNRPEDPPVFRARVKITFARV